MEHSARPPDLRADHLEAARRGPAPERRPLPWRGVPIGAD